MLFGFERDRYPALNGGRRGGWLNVEMADGRRFRIERYGDRGGGGKLSVQDEHHQELGEGALATLLQGVESGVYRNIFAFGLEELTQFRSLTDAEVAARIYGAGLGTGSVSGLDVEGALAGEMEALFKPGGQLPRINKLLRELEELDAQLKDRDLPADYAAAGTRLAEVERRLEELGATYADDLRPPTRPPARHRWLAGLAGASGRPRRSRGHRRDEGLPGGHAGAPLTTGDGADRGRRDRAQRGSRPGPGLAEGRCCRPGRGGPRPPAGAAGPRGGRRG